LTTLSPDFFLAFARRVALLSSEAPLERPIRDGNLPSLAHLLIDEPLSAPSSDTPSLSLLLLLLALPAATITPDLSLIKDCQNNLLLDSKNNG
jgi:hypothetical protein